VNYSSEEKDLSAAKVARLQGLFNLVGGGWPILNLSSFELVYGRKRDVFLQKTVGGLLFCIGWVQLTSRDSPEAIAMTRRLGVATALTLLLVDLVYIPKGEMRWTYWQDAACELGWIAAWVRASS
jgi:hypothetical protein